MQNTKYRMQIHIQSPPSHIHPIAIQIQIWIQIQSPPSHLHPIWIHSPHQLNHLQQVVSNRREKKISLPHVITFLQKICLSAKVMLCRLSNMFHLSPHDTQLGQTRRPEAVTDQNLKCGRNILTWREQMVVVHKSGNKNWKCFEN